MRFPLEIRLRPSGRAVLLNAAIHVIAAFAFLKSSFHPFLVGPALVFLALSCRSAAAAEKRKADIGLTLESDGTVLLHLQKRRIAALPQPTSTDFGWALWLHWEGSQNSRSRLRPPRGALMILPDSVGQEHWRELRIWFRHVAKPALNAALSDSAEP